jgi:hypothetical protein
MRKPKDSEDVRRKMLEDCLAEVAAVWRMDEVKPAMLQAYWRVLGRYDADRIREGFDGALATEKFFPLPAKVLEHIHERPEDRYEDLNP